jgi:glycosyltransferase involved in cell wall biosynthesis
MKKVLLVSNVITQIIKFNSRNIDLLKELGYEVHVACNIYDYLSCPKEATDNFINVLRESGITIHHIDFGRRIKGQLLFMKPYKQLLKLLRETKFEFIHCHSMIAGLCGRLACRKTKTYCIYTAHGFTFFKGSSLFNWLFAYPEDKILARFTNCLITITTDDYKLAVKKFKANSIVYIHGVGVELSKFDNKKDDQFYNDLKQQFDIKKPDFVLVSVGEINKNKNHLSVIKAMERTNIVNWKYIICGEGPEKEKILNYLDRKNIRKHVYFAGYRDDINHICALANLFIHPSFREGLSVALMEGIAAKVPVICSDIRGNKDLIINPERRFNPKKIEDIKNCILKAYDNYSLDEIENNYSILLPFSSENVDKEMNIIYKKAKQECEKGY